MKVLITGAAGFIGFHTVECYANLNYEVIGIDNINDYYPTSLKYDRLRESGINESDIHYNALTQSSRLPNYKFMKMDLEDAGGIMQLFQTEKFDLVINLAAQAGVRYSLENPKAYINSNIVGFLNILEACRYNGVVKLIYASSSSVYGMSDKELLSVEDRTDHQVSLYAATKKSNELMAHVYSHLYDLKTIGLRFFTVYGPWGRPDMAPFLFADRIINNQLLQVFNHGDMRRDFTFIDDIVEGILKVSVADINEKYKLFNIGNNSPVNLMDFISCLESELNISARLEMLGMQQGDVIATWADTTELISATGYSPKTSIQDGVKSFVKWYKEYYRII
ncbi:NAD-dependent epimerase/dehydratase family protein [Sediminibacterium sp. C3]|uniref:NAD-dependent epimerase/dehydratase family protein n=1 Tax=Sediminibacterium sp. C3 TaxID=1267211 RepID=UPI0004079C5E|nr:NAD-dependent epimerase/dehydratase family protein [Sediminibacterium sp. C3]